MISLEDETEIFWLAVSSYAKKRRTMISLPRAGDENRRMTSLEYETLDALARPFPYMQRKKLTPE